MHPCVTPHTRGRAVGAGRAGPRPARSAGLALLAAGIVALALTAGPGTGAAWAQDSPCRTEIVDGAEVLEAVDEVEAATSDLRALGAEVYVRTFADTAGPGAADGNLDARIASLQAGCGTWQSADGGVRDDLIVIAIDVSNRRVGIYYGARWDDLLGLAWPQIQAEDMNPAFRAGDYTAGIVNGLVAIGSTIASLDTAGVVAAPLPADGDVSSRDATAPLQERGAREERAAQSDEAARTGDATVGGAEDSGIQTGADWPRIAAMLLLSLLGCTIAFTALRLVQRQGLTSERLSRRRSRQPHR